MSHKEKKTGDSYYFERYYHPYPQLDLNKITVVREIRQRDESQKSKRIYGVLIYYMNDRTSEIVFELEVPEPEIQRAAIYSPVLGPDGKMVYFVMKKQSTSPIEIVGFNLQKRSIEKRFPLEGSDRDFLLGDMPMDEKIRFGKNSKNLYTDFWGIWKINLEDDSIEQIWEGGKSKGKRVVKTWGGILGKLNQTPEVETKAIEALYGSREFPIAMPIHSPNRRFYFYHLREEGWLAKNWIGVYDKQEKKNHTIKTTSRSIYAE